MSASYTHFKFTDEGIFGNPDVEFNLLGFIHTIYHTTCDDCDGITTGHCGVDVKAVDVPVVLSKFTIEKNSLVGWLITS